MDNKSSRPLLLVGLIITLICFIVLTISSLYGIYATIIIGDLSNSLNDAGLNSAVAILAISFGLILIFTVLGIIFSSIALSRTRLPQEEFNRKRGMITTTIVFAIIIAVLEIFGLLSEFNLFNLIFIIVLIVAVVLMIIGRNKKVKSLQENQDNQNNINNQNYFNN